MSINTKQVKYVGDLAFSSKFGRRKRFTGKINNVPVTGNITFSWIQNMSKAQYTVIFDDKRVRKHKDYKLIRKAVLYEYSRFWKGDINKWAIDALNR